MLQTFAQIVAGGFSVIGVITFIGMATLPLYYRK